MRYMIRTVLYYPSLAQGFDSGSFEADPFLGKISRPIDGALPFLQAKPCSFNQVAECCMPADQISGAGEVASFQAAGRITMQVDNHLSSRSATPIKPKDTETCPEAKGASNLAQACSEILKTRSQGIHVCPLRDIMASTPLAAWQ